MAKRLRWTGAIGAAWLVSLSLACGDSEEPDGDGDDGDVPRADQWAVPRVWTAAERFGYAVVMSELVAPDDLSDELADRSCSFDVQFAEAAVDGGLVQLDREGDCILVEDRGIVRLPQADLNPLCADEVVVSTTNPAFNRRLDICVPAGNLAPPVPIDCGLVDRVPDTFSVTSGVGTDPADTITELDASVDRPAAPIIEFPPLAVSGIGVWPDGPLEVRWTVPTRVGSYVEVTVSPRNDSDGPFVRCIGDDDGALVVSEGLLGGLRNGPVAVEVTRTQQTQTSSDGVPFRISFQVKEAFWLNGRGT